MTTYVNSFYEFRIVKVSYSGIVSDYAESLTREEAEAMIERIAAKWEKHGYPVTVTADAVEVSTPYDAVLVGDAEGTYTIKPMRVKGYTCRECGDVLPCDVQCECAMPHGYEDELGEL